MNGSVDLQELIEAVLSILLPLKEGEFSEKLNKVSMYIVTIGKGFSAYDSVIESIWKEAGGDQDKCSKEVANRTAALKASIGSSIRFARMNLDLAMVQALDKLVRRPKSANKVDESKRKQSLGEWFDRLTDPAPAMLEHFKASSNPLDKWLVAGQWGHEYLRKRHVDLEAYDRKVCELIPCSDHAATRVILNYGKINRAIDAVEERFLKTLGMPEGSNYKMSYVDGLNSFNEHDEKLAMSQSGFSCGEKWSAWPTYARNGRYESKADKPNL